VQVYKTRDLEPYYTDIRLIDLLMHVYIGSTDNIIMIGSVQISFVQFENLIIACSYS